MGCPRVAQSKPFPTTAVLVDELPSRARALIRQVTAARKLAPALDLNDLLILTAVAEINFSSGRMTRANMASVADFIASPRETVRRRILRLVDHGFLVRVDGEAAGSVVIGNPVVVTTFLGL